MTIKQFLSIVEIKTKIVSITTFLVALSYAFLQGMTPRFSDIVLLFFAILFVDMGTTAFNSFFDFYKGVDTKELKREKEKVIVYENVPPAYALLIALTLFLLATLIGLYFILTQGIAILFLGFFSLLVAFLYSGGPVPISHTPFGEFFAGGFLGTVEFVVIQIILSNNELNWRLWITLSLPLMFIIGSILTVNNTCDLEADKRAGRKTLSILIGRKMSIASIALLIVAAYSLNFYFSLTGKVGLTQFGLIIFPIFLIASLIIFSKMIKIGLVQKHKGISMKRISDITLLHSIAILINVSIAIF